MVKHIFRILKNSLDSNEETELYQSLEDKYKKIYGIKKKYISIYKISNL